MPQTVLMISPGFPAEMPWFTRGLARVGARVVGLGQGPESALPPPVREALSGYLEVPSLLDEEETTAHVRRLAERVPIERVESLWEPTMLLAARLREALGLPGLNVAQTLPFRDKERMKRVLDAAGIRTPRHASCATERECREAAERIGYPLIVKPVAGAGSADTHRVEDSSDLERVLALVRHVPVVSVEEFIDGEELTFDTITAGGRILYHNVSWYRPRPLLARTLEWTSPQTVALRNPHEMSLANGIEMGRRVLAALGFDSGFTHMEWFRTASGEAVFGEIGARPPGARSVDIMNYASDIDTFTGWAEAVCHGRFSQEVERRYNAAVVFKRARGQGRIRRIEGVEALVRRYRPWVVCVDLLRVGTPRRNWKQTLLSDGYVIVRHPDLGATIEMADRVGTDVRMLAE